MKIKCDFIYRYIQIFSCLFVWSFSYHSRIFHSIGDITIAGEGLQNLTFTRHLWRLSSEDSVAYHIYLDKGHPFIVVIPEDPWHSNLIPSVKHWSCHYLFLRLTAGIRTSFLLLLGERCNPPRLWRETHTFPENPV